MRRSDKSGAAHALGGPRRGSWLRAPSTSSSLLVNHRIEGRVTFSAPDVRYEDSADQTSPRREMSTVVEVGTFGPVWRTW